MSKIFEQFKNNNKGVIALLLVIMITTLTLVSSIILSMNNTSDMLANYHMSEAANVNTEIDSCIDDALYHISSSSDAVGFFFIDIGDVTCAYEIGATANGIKYVTSTASTTSAIGSWAKTVVTAINVNTNPISIESYKDSIVSYDSFVLQACGNGAMEGDEVCDDGNTDVETQTCGNGDVEGGTSCNEDCSAEIVLPQETCDTGASRTDGCGNGDIETAGSFCNIACNGTTTISVNEVCDDGDQVTETQTCGNGIQEFGTFCNATCSTVISLDEACDSTLTSECSLASGYYAGNYTHAVKTCTASKVIGVACNNTCDACAAICSL